jgi:hypothetical protein
MVPIFVLNNQQNDILPGDENQIPPNGNPHLENGQFNLNYVDPLLGFFEDVGDVQEVQQENENQDWEMPPPP